MINSLATPIGIIPMGVIIMVNKFCSIYDSLSEHCTNQIRSIFLQSGNADRTIGDAFQDGCYN